MSHDFQHMVGKAHLTASFPTSSSLSLPLTSFYAPNLLTGSSGWTRWSPDFQLNSMVVGLLRPQRAPQLDLLVAGSSPCSPPFARLFGSLLRPIFSVHSTLSSPLSFAGLFIPRYLSCLQLSRTPLASSRRALHVVSKLLNDQPHDKDLRSPSLRISTATVWSALDQASQRSHQKALGVTDSLQPTALGRRAFASSLGCNKVGRIRCHILIVTDDLLAVDL
jgi:hypothetical protein